MKSGAAVGFCAIMEEIERSVVVACWGVAVLRVVGVERTISRITTPGPGFPV